MKINSFYVLILIIQILKENNSISIAKNYQIVKNGEPNQNKYITQKEIGSVYSMPNGPISDENSLKKKKQSVVAYLSDYVKDLPIGNLTLTSEDINVVYPISANRTNYQNEDDKEEFKKSFYQNKTELEAKIINLSLNDNNINPYKIIYDIEKDNSILKNNNDYKKHLLKLRLEKEKEIYQKMVDEEKDEHFKRRKKYLY